jgi:hypothetical protein
VGSKEMERLRRQKQSRNKLQNNRNIDQNLIKKIPVYKDKAYKAKTQKLMTLAQYFRVCD